MNAVILRFLMVILLCCRMLTDESPCNPWASLTSQHQIKCLAALREPLDRAPNDQHLLGLAIMSYVNLSLGGSSLGHGDYGPWVDYALELAARRQKARGAKLASSAQEMAPEWWLRIIADGATKQVMDEVGSFPAEQNSPAVRAIRVLATRDWRLLEHASNLTPHEMFARVISAGECGKAAWFDDLDDASLFSPLTKVNAYADSKLSIPSLAAEREVLTQAAWFLRSYDLSDADAVRLAREFATGMGVSPDEHVDRSTLIGMVQQAARVWQPDDGKALATALRISEELSDRPHGMMDGQHHRLVGLGDVARDLVDHLYNAVMISYGESGREQGKKILATFKRIVPQALVTARMPLPSVHFSFDNISFLLMNHEGATPKPAHALLQFVNTAIRKEWARPRGLSPALIAYPITKLADLDVPLTDGLIEAAVKRYPADGHGPRPNELIRLVAAARRSACVPELRNWLTAAVAADPWSLSLRDHWMHWQPDRVHYEVDAPLGKDDKKNLEDRVDANIDCHGPPLSGSLYRGNFIAHWRGSVKIEKEGRYRFSLASDDGSWLSIGGAALDNWHFDGYLKRCIDVDLKPGWNPIEVAWYRTWPGGACRLRWRPPGGKGEELIPPALLTHGDDHQPGLKGTVRGALGLSRPPLPVAEDIAWANGLPYQYRAAYVLGVSLSRHRRHDQALPLLERAQAGGLSSSSLMDSLVVSAFFSEPPSIDKGIEWAKDALRFEADDTYNSYIDVVMDQIIRVGAEKRMAITLGNEGYLDNGRRSHALASLALPAGEFEHAWKAHDLLEQEGYESVYWYARVTRFILERVALRRILGKPEPDFPALTTSMDQFNASQVDRVALLYYSGEISWEDAESRIPHTPNGENLRYYRALQCIADKLFDEAKLQLNAFIAASPNDLVTASALGLRRWLDSQSPAQLMARPQGNPIPRVKTSNGANDF